MPDANPQEFHLDVTESGIAVLVFLESATGLTRTQLKQAMDKGALWLSRGRHTRRLRRVKTTLNVGDILHLYFNSKVLAKQPSEPQLIADKQHYSMWFKPYGVYSQGSKWGDHCCITRLVEKQLQRHGFLVHRLDRAAQGLMIIAHNKAMARYFSEQFRQRTIKKVYRAICHSHFPISEFATIVTSPIDGKEALSHIKAIAHGDDVSLMEIAIETGRKHQIRRHLAELGFPILGDRLYGEAEDDRDLQLSSYQMGFICPLEEKVIKVILPDNYQLKL